MGWVLLEGGDLYRPLPSSVPRLQEARCPAMLAPFQITHFVRQPWPPREARFSGIRG